MAAIVRLLAKAGSYVWRASKNPTVRKEALNAARAAESAFSRFKNKSVQLCKSALRSIKNRDINTSPGSLQKKFKHAEDFGIQGNYSPSNAEKFGKAIEEHVANPSTEIIKGTYRGDPVVHYLDSKTGLNVMKDMSGEFVSGWKLNPSQLQHVLRNGALGGG